MAEKMTAAYVCLGSNLGNTRQNLEAACAGLAALPGVTLGAVSPLYFTEPQNVQEQPYFSNQVVQCLCGPAWNALGFLRVLLQLEQSLGRIRQGAERFGPRVIDLDLLLFGQETCITAELVLPHPRMHERAFVLVPLACIAPHLEISGHGTVQECLNRLSYSMDQHVIYQPARKC
ncbi:2-amino-4-hydroxy-6-hydroxymethyldihydropteridine diphosphokinase [Desulfovibrio cuneatus]|uniref:2-amino-4-hydroxy-6- hydroxymethyldihydropteridine diphosphokinase n=1 Tax=Desulfovibrio cuneatus TaxID=159728 RepID=UPI00041FB2C2|nr:2-amino-4-hydroxy-6-hydroxymethyldihydropteridine diphosphokinase [Desulfovibrio cuneatus]